MTPAESAVLAAKGASESSELKGDNVKHMKVSESAAADDPIIETEAFRFSYPGAERPAVLDITFAVQRHEVFGFLGPSGAGKSTTQNVLIGYQTRSTKGTKNQGWKDSGDAIVHDDETPVLSPIATCELQEYWFVAQQLMAFLSAAMGEYAEAKAFWRSRREDRPQGQRAANPRRPLSRPFNRVAVSTAR